MLAMLVLSFASCADSLFYRPRDRRVPPPAMLGVHAHDVTFSAPNGPMLHGWWLPAAGTVQGTVVYCHGNTGHIGNHVEWIKWLPAHGFQVLTFDYRGYGRSVGETTRRGTIDDAIAAVDFALARDPRGVVVFGHSLGGAIGIQAAAARPAVRAVVAESSFPSYREAARGSITGLGWLLQFLVSDGCDPDDVLDKIPPRPLLVMHGDCDHIVPLAIGMQLFERAHPPKQLRVFAGCRHRTPWAKEGAKFERLLVEFFRDAIRRSE